MASAPQININIMIPESCDIGEVVVYKYIPKDKNKREPKVQFANKIENFEDDDESDSDYTPSDDSDSEDDEPLDDKQREELAFELQKLIEDQALDVEWYKYNNDIE